MLPDTGFAARRPVRLAASMPYRAGRKLQTGRASPTSLRESLNARTYGTGSALRPRSSRPTTVLVVGVPNEFTKIWIESHFGSPAGRRRGRARAGGRAARGRRRGRRRGGGGPGRGAARARRKSPDQAEPASARMGSKLNPRYTFDLFVIGPSNRFAHAAALAVAESPAQAYNPLFIYGSTGLGKTHLLQAVGQYVRPAALATSACDMSQPRRVMNEFVDALRDKNAVGFKHRYRTYDVLLVDDIQFLEGKENAPGGVFPHLQQSLRGRQADRHLVGSSCRSKLATLEARLRIALRMGSHHGRPAARPRDPDRDPAQEGHHRRPRASPTPRC